jgi:plastocyanin
MKPIYALLVAATVALIAVGAGSAAPTKLFGTVGPGFTISLKTSAGAKVTSLKAGTYTFVVADKANIHNFDLKGPVSKVITQVGFTGTKTVTLTLKKGSYSYRCDVHPTMVGHYKVT